jgi:NAD(P)-dependent dehydrogenase (short-subunit alcohol dehydrogenase family)
MNVAVIQGCSSGIGLQFARLLLQNSGLKVAALTRKPSEAKEAILKGLDVDSSRLLPLEVDIKKEDSIQSAAESVRQKFGDGSLRLLINVSGIVSKSPLMLRV